MKKIISFLAAAAMSASMLGILPASASDGSTLADPTKYTLGQTVNLSWSNESRENDNYYEFTTPANGYITITASRPIHNDSYQSIDFELYDNTATEIWDADTYSASVNMSVVTYKIGLKKGTYTLHYDCDIWLSSNDSPVSATLKVSFTSSNYYEHERNDTQLTASPVSVGSKYTGFINSDSYSYDYYKFTLTSKKKIRVYLYNYPSLEKEGIHIWLYYKPNSDYSFTSLEYGSNLKKDSSGNFYYETDLEKGTYYLSFRGYVNDGVCLEYGFKIQTINPAKTTTKPAKVVIKNIKGGKTTAKIKWYKVDGAKGYQIQYSKKKNYKKAKKKTTSKTKITLKKLTGKKYFVRVRAFKKVNGKKICGPWTKFKLKRVTVY